MSGLSLTGERTLPGIWHERYWFARHEVVYRWLAPALAGRLVLEAGCGEGYGGAILRTGGAGPVVAVDYFAPALVHLRRTYPGLVPTRANLVSLPFADGCADAVVSLQTIEHLWEQPRFVAECARVLAPGGLLAVSTPNRLTFSPGLGRGEKPLNPFHFAELDPGELLDLLRRWFDDVDGFGVRHGPRIRAWEDAHGSLVAAQLAAPSESWPPALAGLVRTITADDFEVRPGSLDDCLDLVVTGRVRP